MTTQVELLTDTKNLAIFSVSSKNSCQRKQAPDRINNIRNNHDYISLEYSALKSRPHFLETRERVEKPAHVWSRMHISSKVFEQWRLCLPLNFPQSEMTYALLGFSWACPMLELLESPSQLRY